MIKKSVIWILATLLVVAIGLLVVFVFGWLPAIAVSPITPIAWDCFKSVFGKLFDLVIEKRFGAKHETPQKITSRLGALPQVGVGPTQGLRSYEKDDANEFIHLVPGPESQGLPKSIAFWKSQIETDDPEEIFKVALLYGVSGCGKSSLMKAGILPNLSDARVVKVYVAASSQGTERRLVSSLQKYCPSLNGTDNLESIFGQIQHKHSHKKILIVLDQFEQYLHANFGDGQKPLLQALEKCDGRHLQVILMVRHEYITQADRFINRLANISGPTIRKLVDLFNKEHARKVLELFGRGLGKLDRAGVLEPEEDAFLNQVVQDLANREGLVICVQLALFAQMTRAMDWKISTLQQIGGASRIVSVFLEQMFVAKTAPQEYRRHEAAARAVLSSLLPQDKLDDIKGAQQSRTQLMEASTYKSRPDDFEQLINILDTELHLITPEESSFAGQSNYQLTHDYLVQPIEEWLNLKKTTNWRGRAAILLAQRAKFWDVVEDYSLLPSIANTLTIYFGTDTTGWTTAQQRVMKAASWKAIRRSFFGFLLIFACLQLYWCFHAKGLVEKLEDADITRVPAVIESIKDYPTWSGQWLAHERRRLEQESPQSLHVNLALLGLGCIDEQPIIFDRLMSCDASEFFVLRNSLLPYKDQLLDQLCRKLDSATSEGSRQKFRAAAALATFDPVNEKWNTNGKDVAVTLVALPGLELPIWTDAFSPVSAKLAEPLAAIFRDSKRQAQERFNAAQILAEYLSGDIDKLAKLLVDADVDSFRIFFRKFNKNPSKATELMRLELDEPKPAGGTEDEDERIAKCKANAAVALLRIGQPQQVWPLMGAGGEPTLRAFIIHRLGPLGCDPQFIIDALDKENDKSIKRALILAIGECHLSTEQEAKMVSRLCDIYRLDDDPGLHGSSEWLLRTWHRSNLLDAIDRDLKNDETERIRKIYDSHKVTGSSFDLVNDAKWYINGQGQTMVVLPVVESVQIGSPTNENKRQPNASLVETLHPKAINRSFAISAKAVTVRQYLSLNRELKYENPYSAGDDSPVVTVSWFEAAEYCNKLSESEHLPPIYDIEKPSDPQQQNEGQEHVRSIKMKSNFLELDGYRLPTEAEWECACRAKVESSHYYGQGEELLGKYAWTTEGSKDRQLRKVGELKPNDLGLFDMLGNAWQWCQDRGDRYLAELDTEDERDLDPIGIKVPRIVRGGSFTYPAWNDRCASRQRYDPTTTNNNIGFRIARTFQ